MFGQWCVTSSDVMVKGSYRYIKVSCSCGTVEGWRSYDNLHKGKSKGCDSCARGSKDLEREVIYNRWYEMKRRCTMKSHPGWNGYGGRGIEVAAEWLTFQTYYDYVINLEGYHEGAHLDRINNNGNYEPGNVRWVTPKQNGRNKRNTLMVEYNNETISFAEFVEKYTDFSYSFARRLFKKGTTLKELAERIPKATGRRAQNIRLGKLWTEN
jgi:hypothetical protein